jgi:uncharacterized ferritin-like protein (DUF455 family)
VARAVGGADENHSSDPRATSPARTLRHQALAVVLECKASSKAALGRAADPTRSAGSDETIVEPAGIPGRPDLPVLVAPGRVASRSIAIREGHAALIHALAHIELNAIDLAADACWRFADMPDAYYRDWTRVMQEEALHFQLLAAHLAKTGFSYGDFPAHDALWQMAERTKHDVVARIALVPRTLEARGLDASPAVRHKLASAGDRDGAAIIDRILRDEIGHVAIGNRWFAYLCERDGAEPVATFAALAARHDAPLPRGPFNREARLAAGFSEVELDALVRPT